MNGHDTDRRDPEGPLPEAQSQQASRGHYARLNKRSEFLAAAKGVRIHDVAFTIQAIRREGAQEASPVPRFGLTVTKKTGNSVVRNRIRRRLREALRLSPSSRAPVPPGMEQDVVIVARREALSRPFTELSRDLERSMKRVDGRLGKGASAPSRSRSSGPTARAPGAPAPSDLPRTQVPHDNLQNAERPGFKS
ncbi:MAG: ribonuclease P protein component [Beijerinckiaceae bacterium]|jgi:ribonuclease P protein component|nr:ribonuclease P protein component [Beijerinckiaceae bacterium]MDO9440257.1 ribonuclease P protein component [Beijerinckiaceae bacterium]